MEFFETFWVWLDARLALYITTNTQRVAAALTPAIVVLGTIYIMMWGYLHLMGRVEEPFSTGLKRIITLTVVFGMCLHLWLYNDLLVDTFYRAPADFAGAVIGANDPVQVIDAIWARGAQVAENLQARYMGLFIGLDFLIMAYVIRVAVAILCVYTFFLIALSKVALSVLLALGPFFIVMLLFEQTRGYFRSWIALMSNYALITILTVMVCALILGLVEQYSADTLARGVAILTADALNLVLVCVLAFLFMLQVPQIASSLGTGGGALNTFGAGRWAYGRAGMQVSRLKGLGVGAAIGGFGLAGWLLAKNRRPQARDLSSPGAPGASVSQKVPRNSIEQR